MEILSILFPDLPLLSLHLLCHRFKLFIRGIGLLMLSNNVDFVAAAINSLCIIFILLMFQY